MVLDTERTKALRRSSWVGIIGNSALAVMKIVGGFFANSFALIGDGIDSAADIVTSIITLITARISESPPDKEHPWGHGRAEVIASKILSFIIFFAGMQLALNTIKALISGASRAMPSSLGVIFAFISIVSKAALSVYKFRIGRRHKSPVVIADAENMRNDIILSVGTLCGLSLTLLFNIPILDTIIGVLVSIWIMRSAILIFIETSREVMDSVKDPQVYQKLFKAVDAVSSLKNPHRARIRSVNNLYDIVLDVEASGNISLREAHALSQIVEKEIKKRIPDILDIVIHIEPAEDEAEHSEGFGLSPDSFAQRSD